MCTHTHTHIHTHTHTHTERRQTQSSSNNTQHNMQRCITLITPEIRKKKLPRGTGKALQSSSPRFAQSRAANMKMIWSGATSVGVPERPEASVLCLPPPLVALFLFFSDLLALASWLLPLESRLLLLEFASCPPLASCICHYFALSPPLPLSPLLPLFHPCLPYLPYPPASPFSLASLAYLFSFGSLVSIVPLSYLPSTLTPRNMF
jgi:hypothetical protein